MRLVRSGGRRGDQQDGAGCAEGQTDHERHGRDGSQRIVAIDSRALARRTMKIGAVRVLVEIAFLSGRQEPGDPGGEEGRAPDPERDETERSRRSVLWRRRLWDWLRTDGRVDRRRSGCLNSEP